MNVIEFKKKTTSSSKINQNNPPPQGISAIGIDLGTTNSVVSIFQSGQQKPETLLYNNSPLIPSILYVHPITQEIIVGENAKQFLQDEASEVIKSTKKNMGQNSEIFSSHKKSFTAEEVATHILRYVISHPKIMNQKEQFGGIWAVITLPAHFDDAARTATIIAAENAGINVLRMINEPTSAALAYSMLDETDKNSSENLAIFDFGGGTFDVSIVSKNELTFQVLSSDGDVHLGGDDIDECLCNFLLKKVEPQFSARRASKTTELYRKVLELSQQAKKTLQTQMSVDINHFNLDGNNASISVQLERNEFEEMILPLLQRTLDLTQSAIQAAKKSPKNISRILLVGGSTRLTLIQKLLQEYFPCQVDARLEPDIAVSWGACLQAAIILGIHLDTILVDVCSYSLGIGVVESPELAQKNIDIISRKYAIKNTTSDSELKEQLGDNFEKFQTEVQGLLKVAPILYRNTSLPACKSEFFHTIYPNQFAIHVIVVQGEEKTVGENRLIGSFLFQLQQPTPKGTRCEIQLTYDVNGMVHVFAKQIGTQNELRANFDSRTGEAKGWSPVDENVEDNEFTNPNEEKTNVIAIPWNRFSKTNKSNTILKTEFSDVHVINALLLKSKKFLSTLEKNSVEFNNLNSLIQNYSNLLNQAKIADSNDTEMDSLEDQLLNIIERT